MSDNYLRVIPTDARYVPPADVAAVAAALVSRALPGADLVSAQHHGHPVFIDQGTNLEAIVCPACHSRLAFYGDPQSSATEEWWGQIPDPPEGQSIADVQVAMPCCGTAVPFPNLEFDWPAGVASFEISIRNPGIRGPLTPSLVARLEETLGCQIRQVWAHY